MQPTGNHSDEKLSGWEAEGKPKQEGEVGKGTSFAAGEKSRTKFLAESKCKGNLRSFMQQTLGGDKDLRSQWLKSIQKLPAGLKDLETIYLGLIRNG